MNKILRRIGLLAAAVMLLWGWQGMEAKAADPRFEVKYENPDDKQYIINDGKLEVFKGDNGYYFNLCLKTGYIFKKEPTVGITNQGPATFIKGKLADNKKDCRYDIESSVLAH